MAEPALLAIVFTDLVDSTRLVSELGDVAGAAYIAEHDECARAAMRASGGREIDKSDGFLMLFARPIDAVKFALLLHDGIAALSSRSGVHLATRVGIHLGEVYLRESTPEAILHGAKAVAAEGISIAIAARTMSLAKGGQTLMTRGAFDLARRAAVGDDSLPAGVLWMAHGPYSLKGIDASIEIAEVGVEGIAPLQAPPDSEKCRRVPAHGEEETLGWRPAVGIEVPRRQHWVISGRLGEGGFGEVWLAKHRKLGASRVFKFCFEPERLRGLKREVVLLRLLKETLGERNDVAKVLDWNFDGAPFFIEFEHIPGGDLRDWAALVGGVARVPVEARLRIVRDVADALAAAHGVGVLHKDIKPGNILIEAASGGSISRVVLTDFGIGMVTDREVLAERGITATGLTDVGSTSESSRSGTRKYMAPELADGRTATTAADIYSLGVVLYQLVAGDLDRPLHAEWERDVSDPYLRHLIRSCVVVEPSRRVQGAGEMRQRLEGWADARRAIERQREWKVTLASGCVQAALAGTGIIVVFKIGILAAAAHAAWEWHSLTPALVAFSDVTLRLYASMFFIIEALVMMLAGALLALDARSIKEELHAATGEPTPEEEALWDLRIRAFALTSIGHAPLIILTYPSRRRGLVAELRGDRLPARRGPPGSRRDAIRAILMSTLLLNYAGLIAGLLGLAAAGNRSLAVSSPRRALRLILAVAVASALAGFVAEPMLTSMMSPGLEFRNMGAAREVRRAATLLLRGGHVEPAARLLTISQDMWEQSGEHRGMEPYVQMRAAEVAGDRGTLLLDRLHTPGPAAEAYGDAVELLLGERVDSPWPEPPTKERRQAQRGWARALSLAGEHDRAIRVCGDLIAECMNPVRDDPGDPAWRRREGSSHLEMGCALVRARRTGATGHLERAAALYAREVDAGITEGGVKPALAESLLWLGLAHEAAGSVGDAKAAWSRAAGVLDELSNAGIAAPEFSAMLAVLTEDPMAAEKLEALALKGEGSMDIWRIAGERGFRVTRRTGEATSPQASKASPR